MAVRRPRFGEAVGRFVRDDGSQVELRSTYRNSVKSSWILSWWPTAAIFSVADRQGLEPGHGELVRQLAGAWTLPMPLRELASVAVGLAAAFPEALRLTGRIDPQLRMEIVEPAERTEHLEALAAGYQATAAEIKQAAVRHGIDFSKVRILDVGCGSGYLAFALAGLGAAEVVGIDLDPVNYVRASERARMRDLLAPGRGDAVRLEPGDVHALAFDDGSFDLVYSVTALEHFRDLDRAVSEMSRVTRPGGLLYHSVEPWFAKRGGHGLCTLDFPWGHVRLTSNELERYLADFRPYEAEDAIAYFRAGFQRPPRTLAESRHVFERAGRLLEWRETPLSSADPHRAILDSALLADCRRVHPAVAKRDLTTIGYTVVARCDAGTRPG